MRLCITVYWVSTLTLPKETSQYLDTQLSQVNYVKIWWHISQMWGSIRLTEKLAFHLEGL